MADWTIDDGELELRLSGRANAEYGLACLGSIAGQQRIRRRSATVCRTADGHSGTCRAADCQRAGESFLQISLSPLAQLKTEKLPEWEFIRLPQYAFLRFRENALWFSLGGQNAWKVLDAELVAQDEEDPDDKPSKGIGYVLKCELNLEQVTTDKGEKSGLKQYVAEFERGYSRWSADRHLEIPAAATGMDLRCPDDYEFTYRF
ncbi:MAG: hypothetical protein R3C19_07350 [Planctomycetaceae bacterium]